jgi:endo-1,3-1,4-beta-glycanase ExoK
MSRLLLLAIVSALMAPSTTNAAPSGAFRDGFTTLDPARWTAGGHQLGRSALTAGNVLVRNGALELVLPAGSTDGGEIRSTQTYASGVATTRMRVASAPSSITGFFLYAAPDYASEIDIEVFNDPSGKVMFSTYAGGRQTHTETRTLGFDPTAAPHDYEIAWGSGRVSFSVDGVVLRTWTTGVTKLPMNLYANAWFPAWLDGLAPTGRQATVIDQIEYRRR